MRSMVRWLSAALVLGLGLVVATPAPAAAQVSSVRQAKLVTTDANGNPLLNDIAVATTPSATSARSFDTTAFASAVLTATRVSGDCGSEMEDVGGWEVPGVYGWIRLVSTYSSVAGTITVQVETAPTQSSTFNVIVRPYAQNKFNGVTATCVYDVAMVLVPVSSTNVAVGPVPADLGIMEVALYPVIGGGVTATPTLGEVTVLPFIMEEPSGALLVTGNVTPVTPVLATEDPIVPNSITTTETVYSFDGTKRVTLQANGTGYVWCRVTSDNTLVITSSNYTIALAASTAANDGSGGSITLPYVPAASTYLRCVAGTGTAIVNGFAHP